MDLKSNHDNIMESLSIQEVIDMCYHNVSNPIERNIRAEFEGHLKLMIENARYEFSENLEHIMKSVVEG